ncbi:MAG: RHS repeat protein, partial [Deltaproteobacteria bacterium]
MGRTAPAPDIPPTPGMCPHVVVKAGGGSGGGSGGGGAGSGGGGSGGGPGGGGEGAGDGGPGAGAGAPNAETYKHCGTKSCPVDVGTGRMYTLPEEDLELPGPLPLSFKRQYSSFTNSRDIGLGYGWVHSYAWEVEVKATKTVVWTHTGTWEDFPLLEPGQAVQGKWGWILRRETDGYVLDTNEGVWRAMLHSEDGKRFRLTEKYDRNDNRIELDYQNGA